MCISSLQGGHSMLCVLPPVTWRHGKGGYISLGGWGGGGK